MFLSGERYAPFPRPVTRALAGGRAAVAAGAGALVALTALLWRPLLDAPIHMDTAGYAVAAYWWARGDILYDQISITRPQGIFVIFRLLYALGLGDERGIHLAAAACSLLCALLLWLIAARVWDRTVGFAAAVVFTCLMAVPVLEGPTANADLFMLAPSLLGVLALLAAEGQLHRRGRAAGLLALGGLCAALALLVKPSGATTLLLMLGWIVRWRWSARLAWRALVGLGAAAVGGFLLGLGPAMVHGLVTIPDRYLQDVVFYRVAQDSAVTNGLAYQASRFAGIGAFIVTRLPIVLLGFLGVAAARKGTARQRDLLWLWLATALLGAALGGNWFLHYFQQVLPPLAIAIAAGGLAILRPARSRRDILAHSVGIVGVVPLLALLVCLQWPASPAGRQAVEFSTPDRAPIADPRAVSDYIQAHSAPDARIFVAYQSPDIYYLSERRPAARWLFSRELALNPGAFDEQVARLANPATAPTYIVAAHPLDQIGVADTGPLLAVVARDYRREVVVAGVPIYRRIAAPTP